MTKLASIGAAASLLLVASAAIASDGALEINPACVATGCFPGDTAGLPVQTQAGRRYVMTGDLVVPNSNTDGIALAESATLDMNGFSVSGPVVCTGTPPACASAGSGIGIIALAGSTLRNGAVRGMGSTGVSPGNAVLIESLLIEQNAGAGIAGSSDGSIIRGCRVYRNGLDGIALSYGAGSPGSVLSGNAIVGNGGVGISGAALLIEDNAISGNSGLGINANFIAGNAGFVQNAITNNNGSNANPQTSGGKDLGANVCGTRTTCP